MKDRITPIAVIAVVVLLLVAYVGSYVLLVDKGYPGMVVDPVYRVGGRPAEIFYWPAHQIDRSVRPEHWKGLAESYPGGPFDQ